MRSWLRNRTLWVGAAIVGLLLVLALRPQAVEVELATVTRGPLRVTLDEEGQTRVRDKFLLTAPVAGTVSRIELEPGDRVASGQTYATIRADAPPLLDARSRAQLTARAEAARAALGRARAEAERTAAIMKQAQSDLARLRPLAKAGAVAEAELESYASQARAAEETHRGAQEAVRVAQHERDAADAMLIQSGQVRAAPDRALALRAPVDGVVLRRLRESESVVPAGEGLLEIGDPHQLEIVADYLSADAVTIPIGAAVIVDQWGGTASVRGRVRRIEPAGFMKVSALGVEEQRVNVIIDFIDPAEAWKTLGDGYRVEVRAVLWEEARALKVPVSGLFRQGEQWAVFVATADRAELRTVAIGHRTDREAEVKSGLREGERVIAHPSDTVAAGVRIAPRES